MDKVVPMSATVPFMKPYLTGKELHHLERVLAQGHLSGDGPYTARCHEFFKHRFGLKNVFLTCSATDALEMAALLSGVGPGDEVIIPSYTFVSTANAFALRGATIRFADSQAAHPNVSVEQIRPLINDRTRVIVVVHYAGVACDMDPICRLAEEHDLIVVEDAAQAIGATYKGRPLGSIGHLACFSFHESKNIQCGQGGLAVVNDEALVERAEYAWQKGTNRSKFARGEVSKYRWVDLGSSYLPGESVAALLWSQLEELDTIYQLRRAAWDYYHRELSDLSLGVQLPKIPPYAEHNGHIYQIVLPCEDWLNDLVSNLQQAGVSLHTHYLSLHQSPYFQPFHDGRELPQADLLTKRLVRLPLFNDITEEQSARVVNLCKEFFYARADREPVKGPV